MSDDIHALAGAYALDALDDVERARFEQHLARCQTCQDDVAGYRATAARLAGATAAPAPPALRDRVLAEIQTVRQEPAAVRAIERRRSWLVPVMAAAAAVVVVVSTVSVIDARHDRDHAEQMSAVMTAPDVAHMDLAATSDGPSNAEGTVVWSPELGKAVVTLDGLPALDDDSAYALWFVVDGEPHSAALMHGGADHMVAMIDAPPAGVEMMGVTTEPAAGSDVPTSPMLLAATA